MPSVTDCLRALCCCASPPAEPVVAVTDVHNSNEVLQTQPPPNQPPPQEARLPLLAGQGQVEADAVPMLSTVQPISPQPLASGDAVIEGQEESAAVVIPPLDPHQGQNRDAIFAAAQQYQARMIAFISQSQTALSAIQQALVADFNKMAGFYLPNTAESQRHLIGVVAAMVANTTPSFTAHPASQEGDNEVYNLVMNQRLATDVSPSLALGLQVALQADNANKLLEDKMANEPDCDSEYQRLTGEYHTMLEQSPTLSGLVVENAYVMHGYQRLVSNLVNYDLSYIAATVAGGGLFLAYLEAIASEQGADIASHHQKTQIMQTCARRLTAWFVGLNDFSLQALEQQRLALLGKMTNRDTQLVALVRTVLVEFGLLSGAA